MTAQQITTPSRAGTVPWPEGTASRYAARGYWAGRSLGAHVRAAADAAPQAAALVDGEIRLSHLELNELADGTALALRELGLRPDDRVIVQLPNGWRFAVVVLACLRLGVLPVMALPAHRRHELSHIAAQAEARAVFVPGVRDGFDHEAMAHELVAAVPTLEHVLVAADSPRPGGIALDDLCRRPADPASARAELDGDAPDPRSVALFLLSGGTTGLPKLIARTHEDYAYVARRTAELCDMGPGESYLAALPLGHNFPLACPGLLGTLIAGGRVVIAPSPNPAHVFPLIERERITMTAAVPAIAQRWLAHRLGGHDHDLSSLRLLQVGGSRLADHLAAQVKPVLGCLLQQGYGMAEGLITVTRSDDPDEVIHHTQGRPICPDDELRLVGENGEELRPGDVGVLLARGPYTTRGYYHGGEHNARAFDADGWYRTGDVVRLRPDGNVVVEGREKDMINRGGEKISAEEVENFAYQVPGVKEAAAVAMPDPDLGEKVCLYVVTAPGASVVLEQVVDVMRAAGVARFKYPERLVETDSLPTTSVGKIDKKALRTALEEELLIP